ncbi:MAG: hypothetical protein MZW92_40035 [Comamonadaceae bacterium]|nr:hypothetical protein [Comamonadaceae bacterium]
MSHRPASPSPPPIHFGAGAPQAGRPSTCASRACARPLIVTDRALAALPVLAEFMPHLGPGSTSASSTACSATRPQRR